MTRGAPHGLRVLNYAPESTGNDFKRQDCSSCRHIANCWSSKIDDRLVATNLLVCRIQLGIDRERATKLFLAMVRPKVLKLVGRILKRVSEPLEAVISEIETMIITRIMKNYRIADLGYPLHYLFGPKGAVQWDVIAYQREHPRDGDGVEVQAGTQEGAEGVLYPTPEEDIDEARTQQRTNSALDVIDDGHTLSTLEYRLMRFVLNHVDDRTADDANPRTLITSAAKRIGIPKAKADRLYKSAVRKITAATA